MLKTIKNNIIFLLFLLSITTFSQVKKRHVLSNFTVVKTSSNMYQLQNSKGKVVLDSLKYISKVGHFLLGAFQVIDYKNKLHFYDSYLKEIDSTYKINNFSRWCGTVPIYKLKVLEHTKYYLIQKSIGFNGTYTETKIIDTISKNNVDSLYFFNNKKILKYDDNKFYPENLILTQNHLFQIYHKNQKSAMFDEIDSTNPRYLRVKKGGFWGYLYISPYPNDKPKYITKIKYKILETYNFNLAYFKLENGQSGYVDKKGNEYYNNYNKVPYENRY